MTVRPCTCDPWAPDEACPQHGDDEHRIVDEVEPRRCPWCRRLPRADERHLVLAGTSGPDNSPEPEYVCLDRDDELLPMGDEPVVVPDPWQVPGPVPPPPF